MNNLIEFAKNNRTTTFFRDKVILETRVAYKIMEYLAPDDNFPPKVNQFTKDLMLKGEFSKAYEYVIEELNMEVDASLGCSAAEMGLQQDAMALMAHLLPIYEKTCTDKRQKRRIELMRELKELEG